jgi:hypothetical protein
MNGESITMAYSLLYVSKSLLVAPGAETEVASIVTHAVGRNAKLDVTGALISTGSYFAQLLEGPEEAVTLLMRDINEDPRHMRVKTIRTLEEPRRFTGWSMAYSGNASLVERHIGPLFSSLPAGDSAHLAQRLVGMMEELVSLASGDLLKGP